LEVSSDIKWFQPPSDRSCGGSDSGPAYQVRYQSPLNQLTIISWLLLVNRVKLNIAIWFQKRAVWIDLVCSFIFGLFHEHPYFGLYFVWSSLNPRSFVFVLCVSKKKLFLFCEFAFNVSYEVFQWLGLVVIMLPNLFMLFNCFNEPATARKCINIDQIHLRIFNFRFL
jgi:hypothetical protein